MKNPSIGRKTSKKKKKESISYQCCPSGMDIKTWQIQLRRQAARDERLKITSLDNNTRPGEYSVENPKTRRVYKVVYRGAKSPWNYCSCLDFKSSRLGTCKHIEALKLWFGGPNHVCREIPPYTSVYLDYSAERRVRIRIGIDNEEAFTKLASEYFDTDFALFPEAYEYFDTFLKKAHAINDTFRCYEDALEYVLEQRERKVRARWTDKLTQDDFDGLLHARLYPYQQEGICFAARAGRSIIADEMGLGKTIQAIGTAELLRKKGLVLSVLILCPTSLKYQWRREIERFTGQPVLVIEGNACTRREQYASPETYKIVSYNAVNNDIRIMGGLESDMLIIDEVQRLKNWSTQIAVSARRIRSRYAVILSGTPLENRLEELYSVMELVDNFCLAPFYQFRDRYIVKDEKGSTIGYRNLNEIGERLKPYLIRRRKSAVRLQLPARQDQNLMVPMTKEQMGIHNEFRQQLVQLLRKWERMHFLSETDRKRLLLILSQMRMVCDSTYILDQKSRNDTKVEEVMQIISNVVNGGDDKVVVFSQWERMTRLIAREMDEMGVQYAYLHGGVPSKERGKIVNGFTDNPDCRVFLSTDAGSTGLNLQAASLIINVDLPWNPAVLEQRIARIYRIGQQKNIQVINLVSAGTFEEEMLGKLRFKTSLFEGVLDGGEDTIFASDDKFKKLMEELGSTMEGCEEQCDHEPPIDSADQESSAGQEPEGILVGCEDIPEDMAAEVKGEAETPSSNATDSQSQIPSEEGRETARRVVEQGLSFFSGLAEVLKTPESTKVFVDTIVEEDKETGAAHIKIPVPDKDAVHQLLAALGKLFS